MIFETSFTIQAPEQEVWDFLIDIPRMSVCFPGMQKVEQTGEQTYSGLVEVKLEAARAAFQGSMEMTQAQPPTHLAAQVEGWEVSSASRVTGRFDSDLIALETGQTQVRLRLDIRLEGWLSQFAQAGLQPIFEQTAQAFAVCARRRIERPTVEPARDQTEPGWLGEALRALWRQIAARIRSI